ncbi:MAG TPA: hypothetical protein PKD00_07480 [Burkholderiales bacterium]|nr:hypothetical protein [Burkholderiales bacterium]
MQSITRSKELDYMMLSNLNNQLAVIEVKGNDASKFLQSQLTNDINQLNTQQFQFSAHLNNKGRMLASFIITKYSENSYYLITPLEIIEKIIPRLKMFILRSMVNITQLTNINIIFGNNKTATGLSLELIQTWKAFLIDNAIPFIYLATQELFIPQHVNYDFINGVSYKKGCYTGQEIVARTHYLGKLKKQMYKFTCDQEVKIAQKVVSPIIRDQEAGIIVEVIQNTHSHYGLIVLQTECIEKIFLDIENNNQLLIQAINYDNLN